MRRTLTILVSLSVVLLGVLIPVPGSAHLRLHFDANDAKYDDLLSVRLHAYRSPSGIKMLLASASIVDDSYPDDCCWSVSFVIDSRGDEAADYVLRGSFDDASGGLFYAALETPDGSALDVHVRGTRECGSCYVSLPLHMKFGALHPTRHIRWYAMTGYDRAPDWGWYEH